MSSTRLHPASALLNLFVRRASPDPIAVSIEELAQARARRDVLSTATVGLLLCIKELSLDLTEIGSEELKGSLDELVRLVRAEERDVALDREVTDRQGEILDYSSRMRHYLDEREDELKRIVELLSGGLGSIADDNAAYHRSLQERASRLDRVSHLEDIRRMRQELQGEVAQLRDTVQKKQQRDAEQVASLKRETEKLKRDVEHARNDALTDGLTSAGNRLAFDQHIQALVDRQPMAPLPFALLMIDIDHFKKINDSYGHPVGDRSLIALVQVCREQFRRTDFVARYGGEEFAILLPGASARQALRRAKALCRAQAKKQYAVDGRGFMSFTVSAGVAEFQTGDDVQSLITRADKALYEAKNSGRNRAIRG